MHLTDGNETHASFWILLAGFGALGPRSSSVRRGRRRPDGRHRVSIGGATVLAARQTGGARDAALTQLWRRVDARGWLATSELRVAVRIAEAHRSPLVAETARSLAEHLTRAGLKTELAEARPATMETVGVTGIALPELAIPADWLDAFLLITVTGAGSDRDHRLGAILDAQAEPLRWAGTQAAPAVLALEAHRLAASDLVVVCGEVGAEAWWLISPSDVAAEIAVARCCGLEPRALPLLQALATHESLPDAGPIDGELPRLRGLVGSALVAQLRRATWAARDTRAAMVRDARMIRRNLGKVPNFIRRKLAARRPKTA